MPVIVACGRTPFGLSDAVRGLFRHVRGDELAARAVAAAVGRAGIDVRLVDDVVLGTTQPRGELGGNAARAVALLAGLPPTVGGATVDRGDASGLEALLRAGRSIAAGADDVQVAAGVDHLHHLPAAAGVDRHPRLVQRSSRGALSAGLVAEHLAGTRGIPRARQEDHAAESHARALRAPGAGIVAVEGHDPAGGLVEARADQGPRRDLSAAALAALGPLFLPGSGTITAATSAPDADGAAAMVVMSAATASRLSVPPLARLVAGTVAAVPPAAAGTAAAEAIARLLERQGLAPSAVDLYEIDETWAAVTLATIDQLRLDPARVNVHGGAVAIGHAPGATGLRMAMTLAQALVDGRAQRGVVAMGSSLGQGIALLLERCGP
jgi:acetyl-CoA acetyltransferase family protein